MSVDNRPIAITEPGDLRRWRTEIPNLIDDMDLSVYAFRLYVHLKRVAGASGGTCFQSTRTIATACQMSIGKVSQAKQELFDRGLITIHKRRTAHGDADEITIVDIWEQNFQHYSTQRSPHEHERSPGERECSPDELKRSRHERERSPDELKRSRHERKRSPGEPKKEPIKKEPFKKEPLKKEPPPPPASSATALAEQRQEEEEESQVSDLVRTLAARGIFPATAAEIARRCLAEGVGAEDAAAIADAHVAAGATPQQLAWRLKHAPLTLPASQQRIRDLFGDGPTPEEPGALARPPNVWDQILQVLEHSMTRATFDRWLRGTQLVERQNGALLVAVRDPAAVAWLTHRLDRAIQAAARQVAEAPLTVQFITDSVEG